MTQPDFPPPQFFLLQYVTITFYQNNKSNLVFKSAVPQNNTSFYLHFNKDPYLYFLEIMPGNNCNVIYCVMSSCVEMKEKIGGSFFFLIIYSN